MQKYVLLLGREPSLSLAELKSVFGTIEHEGSFAFIHTAESEIMKYRDRLGWTIKIGCVLHEDLKKQDLLVKITEKIGSKVQSGKKLRVGIDAFSPSLSSLVFKAKDVIRDAWHSIRVVQHEQGRIKTATTIHEKLIEQGLELMVFTWKTGFVLAETVWVQDIEAYSRRDMDRDRSMTVGMMPPKIAQIMINLATKGQTDCILWDPFCGLGTTLIEAFHAGYGSLEGSDIEPSMVQTTQKNIENQSWYGWHASLHTFVLDAREIHAHDLPGSAIVVTEGMLGQNFTSGTITQQAALQERSKLTRLYEWFLESSYRNTDIRRMAFCLPFWNIGRETLYMPAISHLTPSWSLDPLCSEGKRYLRHIRPGQCVGREILVVER